MVRTTARTSTSQSRTPSPTAPQNVPRGRTARPSSRVRRATRSSASAAQAGGQNRTQRIPQIPLCSEAGREGRRVGKVRREPRHHQSGPGRARGWRSGVGHSPSAELGTGTFFSSGTSVGCLVGDGLARLLCCAIHSFIRSSLSRASPMRVSRMRRVLDIMNKVQGICQ